MPICDYATKAVADLLDDRTGRTPLYKSMMQIYDSVDVDISGPIRSSLLIGLHCVDLDDTIVLYESDLSGTRLALGSAVRAHEHRRD